MTPRRVQIMIVGMLLLAGLLPVSVDAQTQQGLVKTLGRPDRKGEALSGVTVRVKGEHNATVSRGDGTILMSMPGKRNGEPYALQQVQKSGYELNEKSIIGRQHAFSDRVPLIITMVQTAQLQADKQRIEDNAYRTAEKNYKARLALLEQQKADQMMTAEQYSEALRGLQERFEKYQSLIDGLAEHYAHIDYDSLSDREREVNICIENGDLERADSLLSAEFDPVGVLERNREALARIDRSVISANDMIRQAEADMAKVLKQQERDAEHLYQLFTIALARLDNEKARHYIETRAELDTTRVEWQLTAGKFLGRYVADYEKALLYDRRSLRLALTQQGEERADAATAYNNLGVTLSSLGRYNEAEENHQQALAIWQTVYGREHEDVALSYNNLGYVHLCLGRYAEALRCYGEALEIWRGTIGTEHADVAMVYNNMGLSYKRTGDLEQAMRCYQQALSICEKTCGEAHPATAQAYHNMGAVYAAQGNDSLALQFYRRALSIRAGVYGENHPLVATSYNSIGAALDNLGRLDEAMECYVKALISRINIYGKAHPEIAVSCNNLGTINCKMGLPDRALEFLQKALAIYGETYDGPHPDVAQVRCNMGYAYLLKQDYQAALNCYRQALAVFREKYGEDHAATRVAQQGAETAEQLLKDNKQ